MTSVCCLTEKADDILGKITYELSEYSVHIRWAEPKDPNGMIILYEVLYKRLGDTEVRRSSLDSLRALCSCERWL